MQDRDKIYQMPIMIKALEIVKLAEGLDKLIPFDPKELLRDFDDDDQDDFFDFNDDNEN